MFYFFFFVIYFCSFHRCIFTQISASSCPYIRTSIILSECVFDTDLYRSFGAHIRHSNAVQFLGYYSLSQTNSSQDHLRNSLIYNLGNRWMLLVPLLIKCAHQPTHLTFTECQYTMRQSPTSHRSSSTTSEYMTTQLTLMNTTDSDRQAVLFLQAGEITLRSCKAFDCDRQLVYLTAANETFNFQIHYEKTLDSPCEQDRDCQHFNSLLRCDSDSRTCQCFDSSVTKIDIPTVGRICSDSIDRTNCTEYPRRCVKWCDQSLSSHCHCPLYTRKVKKINGIYDCELEPTGPCRFDDEHVIGRNIRKCPTGTFCDGHRCRSSTYSRQVIEENLNQSINELSPIVKTHPFDQQTAAFIRTLIVIAIAIVLFFILIILIILILIKSRRCRSTSNSCEDKVSSSSFAHSTSTALSIDGSNHQLETARPSINTISSFDLGRYDSYLNTKTFGPGLVPQTTLSPRFHRQHQVLDDRRRTPLQIRSPSLSRINPFVDHASLATQDYSTNQRPTLPRVTRLKNGDVIISA